VTSLIGQISRPRNRSYGRAIALPLQPRGEDLLRREAEPAQVRADDVVGVGRVADREALGGRGIEPPLAEEPPRRLCLGRRELRPEELLRGGVGREQPAAVALIGCLPAVLVVQGVADAGGEPLDRLLEGDVVHLLQEGVDVAALAAAEAVVEADLRTHVEARAALVVEGAQPLHRPDAGALQGDVVADDVGQIRARPNLVDVAASNEAGHRPDSRRGR